MPIRPESLLTRDGSPATDLWTLDPRRRHLNHASFGATPRLAQEAQNKLRALMETNPQNWFLRLPERLAEARALVAPFVGADPSELVFVPNASAGATVGFANLPLARSAEIVITAHAYGAVAMAAERTGARVRVASVPLDADDASVIAIVEAELNDSSTLIVVDQVTSSTARAFPVCELSRLARSWGVPIMVDGAHAAGDQERPAALANADIWFGNLHKFACGVKGTGILVARPLYSDLLYPVIDSWGYPYPYPERFDQQGTIDATPYLATVQAIRGLEEMLGWVRIRDYIGQLVDYAHSVVTAVLSELDDEDAMVNVGSPAPGMRLVRLPAGLGTTGESATALRARLASELGFETAITTWHGRGYLRLSAHAYNTAEDFERFAEVALPALVRWRREI